MGPSPSKTSITTTTTMNQITTTLLLLLFLLTFHSHLPTSAAQQAYVDNNQLDCDIPSVATNGFLCNNPNATTCAAFLTFRSSPPLYSTPPAIAFLLNSNPSDVARLNNLSSDVGPIPTDRLLVVPVSCSCSPQSQSQSQGQGYYQHNANYTIKMQGEMDFSMANDTYQGLTTCQALVAQNRPVDFQNLHVGDRLQVPLMCACPTARQVKKYGAKYLVSYIVTWGDDVSQIAAKFGADVESVLDANELKFDDVIYPFTPILVPIKTEPINLNFSSSSPVSSSPSPPVTTTLGPTIPKSPGGAQVSSRKWVSLGVGIGGGVLIICFCSFIAWFCVLKKPVNEGDNTINKVDTESTFAPVSSYTTSTTTQQTPNTNTKSWSIVSDSVFKSAIESLKVYKFSELENATGKFDEKNKIKGSVYRAEFNDDNAAVKILKGNVSNDEISILKHINHANIIQLSGYCVDKGNTYVVYEFAKMGSLDDCLSTHLNPGRRVVLGWKNRVQIACNVADALCYLHSYVSPPYVHRNMKSSNVLLDSNYIAKITNFGLARTIQDEEEGGEVVHLTNRVVGTHGYLAPEYVESGVMTTKLDVFAFGVVILELLSGKPAVGPAGGRGDELFVVIRNVFEEGEEDVWEKLKGFVDCKLGNEYPLDLAYSMAQMAYKCVDRDMNSRPSMNEVSMMLSKIYSSSLDWDHTDEVVDSSSSLSHSQ